MSPTRQGRAGNFFPRILCPLFFSHLPYHTLILFSLTLLCSLVNYPFLNHNAVSIDGLEVYNYLISREGSIGRAWVYYDISTSFVAAAMTLENNDNEPGTSSYALLLQRRVSNSACFERIGAGSRWVEETKTEAIKIF